MKPEKRKLREGDTMPPTPKGKRHARRVSRRNERQALQGYIGGYIVPKGQKENTNE